MTTHVSIAEDTAAAWQIFGSDVPPIVPEACGGSWRTTLCAIAAEWEGEGREGRRTARAPADGDGLPVG